MEIHTIRDKHDQKRKGRQKQYESEKSKTQSDAVGAKPKSLYASSTQGKMAKVINTHARNALPNIGNGNCLKREEITVR